MVTYDAARMYKMKNLSGQDCMFEAVQAAAAHFATDVVEVERDEFTCAREVLVSLVDLDGRWSIDRENESIDLQLLYILTRLDEVGIRGRRIIDFPETLQEDVRFPALVVSFCHGDSTAHAWFATDRESFQVDKNPHHDLYELIIRAVELELKRSRNFAIDQLENRLQNFNPGNT